MTLSPQQIRETRFKPAKRGFDQDEVSAFQGAVADALESAQNDATAMEARARAAVARLQELSASGTGAASGASDAGDAPVSVRHSVDEAETISRTLLLAQRTADTTIADAETEAARLLTAARAEADAQLDAARTEVDMLIEAGRTEARRAGEADKVRVEGEVQALLARRDFLESDVEHLEQFIMAQRERLTEAAGQLGDMVQRIPGGLADMRRPLLSAAGDEPEPADATDRDDEGDDDEADGDDEGSEIAEITRVAAADDSHAGADTHAGDDATGDVWALRTEDLDDELDADDLDDDEDDLDDDEDDLDDDADEGDGDDPTPADASLFDDIDRPR